ncbi:hypothetical protein BDV3_007277 [Batrachochytrium dendrobatidis]|nr:hypothetical protein QVD99_005925 [Batrachochytrium dendrobatidis]
MTSELVQKANSLDNSAESSTVSSPHANPISSGRKRKWDVEQPEQTCSSTASEVNAVSTKKTATESNPNPSAEPESAIESTAAATAAAVSRLSALQHSSLKPASVHLDQFVKDIDINDIKNRYLLTNRATQNSLVEETSVNITTRGKFYPDRNRATTKDPPLYLHLIAPTQKALDLAIDKINSIIEQASITLVEPRIHHSRTFYHEKIPVDIDATPAMNLRAKIVGPGGSYMKHIQQETSTRVQLRGHGSGFTEASTGQEADEPMFVNISGSIEKDVQSAKQLCEDLLDTVRKDVEQLKQRYHPPQHQHKISAGASTHAPYQTPYASALHPPPSTSLSTTTPQAAPYNHYVVGPPAPPGYPPIYPYYGGYYGYPPPPPPPFGFAPPPPLPKSPPPPPPS